MDLSQSSNLILTYSTISDGNMSFVRGNYAETLKNRQKFLEKFSLTLNDIVVPRTQDSLDFAIVTKDDLGKGSKDLASTFKVDGLLTKDKAVYLFLVAADCLPIALYDPKKEAIALIHASWKNLDYGIIQKSVSEMKNHFNSNPTNIQVQIGPSVGPCCYKRLDQMAQKDKPEWKPFVFIDENDKYGADLWGFAKTRFLEQGILEQNYYNPEICSAHSDQYYSHRSSVLNKDQTDYRFATLFGIQS